jgi:hypothetical protein
MPFLSSCGRSAGCVPVGFPSRELSRASGYLGALEDQENSVDNDMIRSRREVATCSGDGDPGQGLDLGMGSRSRNSVGVESGVLDSPMSIYIPCSRQVLGIRD